MWWAQSPSHLVFRELLPIIQCYPIQRTQQPSWFLGTSTWQACDCGVFHWVKWRVILEARQLVHSLIDVLDPGRLWSDTHCDLIVSVMSFLCPFCIRWPVPWGQEWNFNHLSTKLKNSLHVVSQGFHESLTFDCPGAHLDAQKDQVCWSKCKAWLDQMSWCGEPGLLVNPWWCLLT